MADVFNLNLSDGQQYPYKVVYSKRAKYIRIKLSRQGELSITLPAFNKIDHAHQFIHSKIKWVETNLANVLTQKENELPEILDLKLLEEFWYVEYTEIHDEPNIDLTLIEHTDYILELRGNPNDLNSYLKVTKTLEHWCKKKSQKIFNLLLQELAEMHGFHFHRLSIRAQKTRWGSCTHQKNINLNCKLLFMPKAVVSYVMIHELCHTIEMNHSSRFWELVEDCDPQYKTHQRELSRLGKELVI